MSSKQEETRELIMNRYLENPSVLYRSLAKTYFVKTDFKQLPGKMYYAATSKYAIAKKI